MLDDVVKFIAIMALIGVICIVIKEMIFYIRSNNTEINNEELKSRMAVLNNIKKSKKQINKIVNSLDEKPNTKNKK